MRHLAHVALAVVLVPALGWALDTSHRAPAKPPSLAVPNTPSPVRQGGDTIDDAITIDALPFTTTGTTTGYNDDYDEACPYTGSTAPDVVYSLMLAAEYYVDIDMLGSSYDTKIYLYDADLELVACNDDFYPDYVSKLENIMLDGGVEFFLVIDGYGAEHGEYVLTISEYEPCILEMPPGAVPEGEPPLTVDYQDSHNGGCNSPEFGSPFQEILGDENGEAILAGRSGWYTYGGDPYRDTDWFHVFTGPAGSIEFEVDAEWPVYVFEMPYDCNATVVIQNIVCGPCYPATMVIPGEPGWHRRLFVGPTTFLPPDGSDVFEFDYIIHFTGLETAVATEPRSWTTIKRLFR